MCTGTRFDNAAFLAPKFNLIKMMPFGMTNEVLVFLETAFTLLQSFLHPLQLAKQLSSSILKRLPDATKRLLNAPSP